MKSEWRLIHDFDEREKIVDGIYADPHHYTQEDIEWCAELWGSTVQTLKDIFIYGKFMLVIFVEDEPIYCVGQSPDGMLNTCIPQAFEGHVLTVSKQLLRFRRSDIGQMLLVDSWMGCDYEIDWHELYYMKSWTEFLGYKATKMVYYPHRMWSWLLRGKTFLPYPHKKWRNLFYRPRFVVMEQVE